jgi:flagellar hook-associated protein 1
MDLFGILGSAQRSLQTQRKGIEVAGNNMANVSTAGYARQRLRIESTTVSSSQYGTEGTGAEAVAVQQLRDSLIDSQIVSEASVSGSLDAQQKALEQMQTKVGQQIDRAASSTDGTASVSGQNGLSDSLSDLFSSFQSLSAQPTSNEARQSVIDQAQDVVDRFHQISNGIASLNTNFNSSISADVTTANGLLEDIAKLNDGIAKAEAGARGTANELRDARQQKLEELAKFTKVDVSNNDDGTVDVAVSGATLVSAGQLADTLEAYDTGAGNMGVRTKTGAAALTMMGGSIQGNMEVRDGALADLKSSMDTLAGALISEVNQIHSAGYASGGTTGADFFTGANAATIAINASVAANPALIQTSGNAGATGDNQTVLALAQLGSKTVTTLNNLTFNESFTRTVTTVGSTLASVKSDIDNQSAVTDLLAKRRDSTSGVSLDEESTDLMKFQKAFQASARVITVVDNMLDTVIGLK